MLFYIKKSSDIKGIAQSISNLSKLNEKKRIVIITQGEKPVILAIGNWLLKLSSIIFKYQSYSYS